MFFSIYSLHLVHFLHQQYKDHILKDKAKKESIKFLMKKNNPALLIPHCIL